MTSRTSDARVTELAALVQGPSAGTGRDYDGWVGCGWIWMEREEGEGSSTIEYSGKDWQMERRKERWSEGGRVWKRTAQLRMRSTDGTDCAAVERASAGRVLEEEEEERAGERLSRMEGKDCWSLEGAERLTPLSEQRRS